MPKKLIVHIGANKTGSSAIQRFLAINHPTLREEGIVVPNRDLQVAKNIGGHHVFSFQELLAEPVEGRRRLEDAVDALDAACPEASTILLSAENLTANRAAPPLFENLAEKYDIRIVIYIRRQDELILSSWQQWHSKIWTDFWAWVLSIAGRLGDWRAYLQSWERVIPRDKITVRVYERSKLEGGDVIADFYSMLDSSSPLDNLRYPESAVNPSFSDAVMDLVKGNDLIFQNVHDNDFYNFIVKMTGDKYKKNSRQSSISFLQRQALLNRYQEQNNWVRESYFPQASGPLFSPIEESDYDYSSPGEMDQEKLEFLTTMLYQMYKRGEDHA